MNIVEFHAKQPPLVRYALAIGIFATALALRFLLIPIESGLAFTTFYPATLLCFYLCGFRPSLLMVGLSTLAAYYFFIPPVFTFAHKSGGGVAIALFLFSAYLTSQVVKQLQAYAAQLKINEQRYLSILEDQTEILCRFKADGTLLYVNDAYCRLFGLTRASLIGSKWQPVAWADDIPLINAKLKTLSPENPVVTIENRIIASGNNMRWGQFVNRAIFDSKGQLIEMQSVGRDITEQKLAKEKCSELSQQLRHIASQVPGVIYQYQLSPDGSSCFPYVSEAIKEICRVSPEEIRKDASAVFAILHPEDYEGVVNSIKQSALNMMPWQHEYRVRFSDGIVRWLFGNSIPTLGADGSVLWNGLITDITERKRTERQLTKLAQALEQCSESVVITNLDAEIEYVNAAFLHSTGYSREEVMGKNTRMLQSGKTPNETYSALWNALNQGQYWKGEFINKDKNGHEHIVLAKISPITQADGQVSHYLEVKEDITDEKQIQLELDQHRHHLEALVASRTLELLNAKAMAELANQAKSTFLANMSHEIRTPLHAIMGFTHLLLQKQPTPYQQQRLTNILIAAQQLLSILNGILDLAKIEAGKVELNRIDFRKEELHEYIYDMLLEQAHAKGLSVTIEYDSVPNLLHGDLTRLKQALLSYASNALKFTNQGTINLRIKQIEETSHYVLLRFEVQDTGIGISAEQLPRMFDIFTQADESSTRPIGGIGLGLAFTRLLANMMGGDSGAESVLGQGSTFWFTAKLQRGSDNASTGCDPTLLSIEQKLTQQYSGAKILLAEDNLLNQEIIVGLLQEVGITVDIAEDGQRAVEMVRAHPFDLVIMDLHMPIMNGLEATHAIRSITGCADLPILALTANAQDEAQKNCLAAGMSDYLAKPILSEMLYTKLWYWLSNQNSYNNINS